MYCYTGTPATTRDDTGRYSHSSSVHSKLLRSSNDNAFELGLPIVTKKHRVFNIKWLKKLITREGLYYQHPPLSKYARMNKLQDIISIVGYDPDEKIYHCKLQCVDPQITIAFEEDEIQKLPHQRFRSLLQNLKTLTDFEHPVEDHWEGGRCNSTNWTYRLDKRRLRVWPST
ncbi:hypothetical protein HG536_0F04780 [Torulaspora globosa]|uniref:Uncharacterized protein n=1 Tax=Torulaspora globosa TaxID=48254 RepID=A0A7G3ZKW5_9SACH|nr:uncharacterized protein HG536_0F04780 [Torulaspora globosa]QLL34151.1 hypothetical protein HG536_0F04780 [Torulaspora globosa]